MTKKLVNYYTTAGIFIIYSKNANRTSFIWRNPKEFCRGTNKRVALGGRISRFFGGL